MDQPSQHIADRYQVMLNDGWRQWFDRDAVQVPLAGEFRETSQFIFLLDSAPTIVWPGLMLPDTLPLIGNEYGDWLCVRVDSTNRFGELVHWYHGGGDWIPVGNTLAEAVLHDVVDQFRPRVGQVLRGATESTSPEHLTNVIERLNEERLQSWLAASLGEELGESHSRRAGLRDVLNALSTTNYLSAIQHLEQAGWSVEAALCDQIEYALQVPDWKEAERLALRLLSRRSDLAWAVDIAGLAAKRRGELVAASEIYFMGRFASAFSNQSIRMRSHGFEPQFGKVALAEMWNLRDHLSSAQRDDSYLQRVWQTPARDLQREVQKYWMSAGKQSMSAGNFANAYDNFYRAGWDIGAQRMTDYLDVFAGLIESAQAAGWTARANVAATHLPFPPQ